MSGRGRPKLPIGTYGEMTVNPAPHSTKAKPIYVARARFRDSDGVTRPVTKSGPTKAAARDALRVALAGRAKKVQQSSVTSETTVAELAEAWEQHHSPDWATNTAARYGLTRKQIETQLGGIRLIELSRSGVNRALEAIRDAHGVRSAQMAKSVLSGMCKHALTFDAIDVNPVRDAISISAGRRPKPTALTVEQVDDLCDKLRADEDAVLTYDLADLVEWMLGTGCRIGEACGARYASLDEQTGTWEINATAVRVKGTGMVIQERPKTAAGWRVLALPSHLVEMIHRRRSELTMSTGQPVIFGSPYAKTIRDPSNTHADLRVLLDRYGYDWVTSHTFRRTAATRLDEAGLTARDIANQLGHSQPSMTLDKYMGRNVSVAAAATILER